MHEAPKNRRHADTGQKPSPARHSDNAKSAMPKRVKESHQRAPNDDPSGKAQKSEPPVG